jgi:L-aspartate oxidase
VRDADGLRRLLDAPHDLVRLIAAHALLREETRGAHVRADFPATDPALDRRHVVSPRSAAPPVLESWA